MNATAELRLFSIPGDADWVDDQQGSLSENTYIELIDLERYEDGIGPLTPARIVPVPDISLTLTADLADAATDSVLFAFSLNVARKDVVAMNDAELEDGSTIVEGTVLVPRWTAIPRDLATVQLLIRAGGREM